MQQEGLIKHLGVSTVTAGQVAEAQSIAPIVCVQNFYNIANRQDDSLIDSLAEQGIAYVPYFPLGGFFAAAIQYVVQRCPRVLDTTSNSRRLGLAAAALAQHSAHTWNVICLSI